MAEQTGQSKATGEGDWPGSRKGIGTRRRSLLNMAKNLSFLSLSHLLLLGHFIVTSSTLAISMGVMVSDFKVWLRMSPFDW